MSSEQITVLITGACTSCKADQLQVHFSVFARLLADPTQGSVKVQYRQARRTVRLEMFLYPSLDQGQGVACRALML